MTYNWQQKNWPDFYYDLSGIEEYLVEFETRTGQAGRTFHTLPEKTRHETILEMMVTEAVKTSEIEGEYISREDVLSSIRNQLGLNLEPEPACDQRAKGVAQLLCITSLSKATATRHLQHLKEIGALTQRGSARSTRYYVNLDNH